MKYLILCIYGRAGYEAFNYLLLNNYANFDKVIVFTHNKNNDLLINFLKNLNIEFYTESINKFENILSGKKGLLLSIHYRNIIKKNIIECFDGYKINLHPSLLPYYKGCFSSVWAIINGEQETGITYHILTPEVDEGNIIIQEKIPIKNDDTALSIFNKLITLGINKLPELFKLINENYQGTKQSEEGSYYPRKVPYDGIINNDWDINSKKKFIRAMYFPPHKGAILLKNNEEIEITNEKDLLKLI